ncbi:hypothetical protein M433DRAFT_159689, partial [Acidomyces richmondensis BFW]
MPLYYYRLLSLDCKVDLRSSRYAECVRRVRKCDLVVTRTEFNKLCSIRLRLKEQLERAEDEEEKLVEEQEALLTRIRTQEGAAFDKELASIEEAEEQERSLLASSSEPVV